MISQAYAHKVESTLSEFGNHLEILERDLKALSAANEGVCAALNAEAHISGDDIASLYDIVLADMRGHITAMMRIVTDINPAHSVKA